MATRQTAADKAAEQERTEAKAEAQKDHAEHSKVDQPKGDVENAVLDAKETSPRQAAAVEKEDAVAVSDPSDNDRLDAEYGVKEPELPLQPAVVDHTGTARLLPSPDRNWEPAPLDASAEDIKRAEERNKREEEVAAAYKEGRVDAVSGRILDKKDRD